MHLLHGICDIQNLVIIAGRAPVLGRWCSLVELEMFLGSESVQISNLKLDTNDLS